MNPPRNAGSAIIIGAGMAGLLAARVLSEHYQQVTVLERDTFAHEPENRSGTPQSYHPHRMLPSGKMLFEKFFPGYIEELLAHGAFQRENRRLCLNNPLGSMEVLDHYDAGCSRALLEWVIRQRVQQLGNVRFWQGQEVTGLLASPDNSAIRGVYLRRRGQSGESQTIPQTMPQTMTADLIVDTSGRSSKVVQSLRSFGYDVPEPERLLVSLGYSTRRYKLPATMDDPASVILVEADPARGITGGTFGTIENNMAELALARAGGDTYPTTDPDLYEAEVAQLLSPAIAEELKKLEPLGDPRGYRVPETLRYHFEQMARWPAGFLVMGDAICNFDPVHGQGMTVAALEADILTTALAEQGRSPRPDFELAVLAKMQEALDAAWWLTLVADLRWRGVTYQGPLSRKGIAFAQKYFDLYLKEVYGRGNQELFLNYFLMNALLKTPSELINFAAVRDLLAIVPPEEADALRAEFFSEGDHQLARLLAEEIPAFVPLALPMPAMLA